VEPEHSLKQSNRTIEWVVWSALLLTILVIATAFVRSQLEQRYLIDLRPISQLPDFALTNQDGRAFFLADMRGNVCVADIIFTSCAGPCPVMTRRMSELQTVFSPKTAVKLLTLTTNPDFDRPEVLKRYGERFKADFARWTFLTGSKEGIARVAVDGMKLTAIEKKPTDRETERDLFIHSTLFVFIDKQGRLRGTVESDDPKMKQKVSVAVKKLLQEK